MLRMRYIVLHSSGFIPMGVARKHSFIVLSLSLMLCMKFIWSECLQM